MSEYLAFRAAQVRRHQPPVYVPLRFVSTLLSWPLAHLGASPHVLTALGAISAIAASVALSQGGPQGLAIASLLVVVAYLLDCMDGEVARIRGVSSVFGAQLDQLVNWVSLVSLQVGLAVGASHAEGDAHMLGWGLFAVAGWCTFYYLYLQFAWWVPPGSGFGSLRRISKALFALMPLDENLVLAAALFRRPGLGIQVSALVGVVLSLLVGFTYVTSRMLWKEPPSPTQPGA